LLALLDGGEVTIAQFAQDGMPGVIQTDFVRRARAALQAIEEKAADDVVWIANQVVEHGDTRRTRGDFDGDRHAEFERGIHTQEHFLHRFFDAVQPLMIRRRKEIGFGDAANRLNVWRDFFGGEQTAIARLGTLSDFDEDASGFRHHIRHRLDDAIPAEMSACNLKDEILEILGLEQAIGYAAFAGSTFAPAYHTLR
jgi:hypothetical protein